MEGDKGKVIGVDGNNICRGDGLKLWGRRDTLRLGSTTDAWMMDPDPDLQYGSTTGTWGDGSGSRGSNIELEEVHTSCFTHLW